MIPYNMHHYTFEDFVAVSLQVGDELYTEFVPGIHPLHLHQEVHGFRETLVVAETVVFFDDEARRDAVDDLQTG